MHAPAVGHLVDEHEPQAARLEGVVVLALDGNAAGAARVADLDVGVRVRVVGTQADPLVRPQAGVADAVRDELADEQQQGRLLALGMSVSDVSGKAIANLATEELKHPAPVFHGDTLFCESEVLEKRESQSKPDRGTVRVHTRVLNQDGVLVAEFKRLVLVPRRHPGPTDAAEANVE